MRVLSTVRYTALRMVIGVIVQEAQIGKIILY